MNDTLSWGDNEKWYRGGYFYHEILKAIERGLREIEKVFSKRMQEQLLRNSVFGSFIYKKLHWHKNRNVTIMHKIRLLRDFVVGSKSKSSCSTKKR